MTIFLSYIFYFIASTLWPLQRRSLALKKEVSEKEQVSFAFNVMLILVAFSFLLPIFQPLYFSGNVLQLIFLSIVSGLCGMGYFVLSYIAQRHVEASITSIITKINTPLVVVLSYFLLHEGLKPYQIIGMTLILVAVLVVSKKHHLGKFKFDKYFLMMAASSILAGFVLVAERALQKTTGFTFGTMLSWWSQCAFLGLAAWVYRSKHTYNTGEVLTTGILRSMGAVSYVVLVWVVGNLSVVSSVINFQVVTLFIAAAIFLHEREDMPRKIIGSIIAVAGLLLMK